ncbi:MAG: hypothetical protein SP1CHLAM54_16440 [Chlamydiia bacterium]|nr:hypothetical protein [Chlamydiia bacterium]MCH9616533.1 hypothetical protein [Chlamydiia bacterium]MCH9629263.1 hypothetical protein [Chlamydiia bacterium]
MTSPLELDTAFETFISNLPSFVPEGVIEVDLTLLEEAGLLNYEEFEEQTTEESLPHYFHVIETSEKVTLFNHQFAIWIVPQLAEDLPMTLVLISLVTEDKPHLELAFSTEGVYNTPKLVLKLIRHFLSEVIDNEEAISSINS